MPGNFNSLPLWQIQTWPTPNYIDPVRRTWLTPYSITLQAISTVLVATRLWLRFTGQAGLLGLDDLLLVPTWISSVGFTVCSVVFMKYGGDRHVWDIPVSYFVPAVKNAWIAQMIYLISTTCVKVSVLLFYRRLVAGTYSKRWKYATIAAIAFTVGYCVSFIVVLIVGCQPTEAYWRSYDPVFLSQADFYCIDAAKANLIAGVLSVVSDLYAVLLPCLMLRHFDAPRRQKIALNVVFSFGLLVVAAGAVRTYYFNGLAWTLDETWLGYDIFVWAQLELQLAIICASAPALRVFFRKYLSDPLSRAINATKSAGSALRSGRHTDSTNSHGVVHYPSMHSRGMSDVKTPQPKYETIDEHPEVEQANAVPIYYGKAQQQQFHRPQQYRQQQPQYQEQEQQPQSPISPVSTTPLNEKPQIRTPADFEHYALENLERNRPFPAAQRPARYRPSSETSFYDHDEVMTYYSHEKPPAHARTR